VDLGLRLGGAPLARRYIDAYLALDPKDINAQGIRFVDRLLAPAGLDSLELVRLVDTLKTEVLRHAAGLGFWEDSSQTGLDVFRIAADSGLIPKAQLAFLLLLRGRMREARELAPDNALVLGTMASSGALPPDSARAFIERTVTTPGVRRHAQRITAALPQVPAAFRPVARYQIAATEAYQALARRDTTTALARFTALPDSLCPFCWVPALTSAQLLAARGRDREAAAVLHREPGNAGDPRAVLWQLERGRVNERLGNRNAAAAAYRRVATLWHKADPELRPYADEARAALQRLTSEPGR
jgi:hypothetical protein